MNTFLPSTLLKNSESPDVCTICSETPTHPSWMSGSCDMCENHSIPTPYYRGGSGTYPAVNVPIDDFKPPKDIVNAPGGESWQYYTGPAFSFILNSVEPTDSCVWSIDGKQVLGCKKR